MRAFSLIALALLTLWPAFVARPAYACSAGPDFNPVDTSQVILMGTVDRWEEVSSPQGFGMYQPIRLTIAVDRVLKGSVPAVVEAYDVGSLIRSDQGPIGGQWAGAGGACGAFDDDPAGKYVVLGLWLTEEGLLQTNRLRTFFIGDESELTGERKASILDRLSGFGLIVPPVTGSGGLPRSR